MIKTIGYLMGVFKYTFKHRKGLLRYNRIAYSNGECDYGEYLCGVAFIYLCVFMFIDIPVFFFLAFLGVFFI